MARKLTPDEEEIKILEELARDPELKATQRLRAMEELGRRRNRMDAGVAEVYDEGQAPDPMSDLDELEARRDKRRRRTS